MAIAEDASAPVALTSTTNVATTASFTPPAGALIVCMCVVGNSTGTATLQTGTVTWGSGGNGTWTLAKRINTSSEVSAEIWYCQLAGAPGASTITLTGTATTGKGTQLTTKVVTGAASGAAAIGANVSASATSFQIAITTTVTGSQVYMCTGQNASSAVLVANGSTTTLLATADATNGERYYSGKATALTGTPGAITVGSSSTGVATSQTVAVEILAATAAAAIPDVVMAPIG